VGQLPPADGMGQMMGQIRLTEHRRHEPVHRRDGGGAGDGAAAQLPYGGEVAGGQLMGAFAQLHEVFRNEDAHRGRTGRLPAGEVKRLCSLYQLKVSPVVLEAAITRASAHENIFGAPGSRTYEQRGFERWQGEVPAGPQAAVEVSFVAFLDELVRLTASGSGA